MGSKQQSNEPNTIKCANLRCTGKSKFYDGCSTNTPQHTADISTTEPTPTTTTAAANVTTTSRTQKHVSDPVNSIVYVNAQSVLSKINKIEMLCDNLKPKILCCSEARLTNEIADNEYNLNGYSSAISYSDSRHTGGVILYIKKPLKFKVIHNLEISKCIWCIAIELFDGDMNGIYIGLYRSPNGNENEALQNIDEFLEKTIDLRKTNIIMGDINIDLSKQTNKCEKVNRIFDSHGMSHCFTNFTRITNTTQTRIDIIMSNENDRLKCTTIPEEEISDHETIKIEMKMKKKKQKIIIQK